MVMTCCRRSSCASVLLVVLFSIAPQLAGATPVVVESLLGSRGNSDEPLRPAPADLEAGYGASRTHRRADSLAQAPDAGHGGLTDAGSARALASMLLEALDHPGKEEAADYGPGDEALLLEEAWRSQEEHRDIMNEREEEEGGKMVGLEGALMAIVQGEEEEKEKEEKQKRSRESEKLQLMDEERGQNGKENEKGSETEEEEKTLQGLLMERAGAQPHAVPNSGESSLQRKIRGYFQNIDLGLQDNEILPPLKGYKAYNQQLAQASKKVKWQEGRIKSPAGNFMDDFDNEEEEGEEEDEEEALTGEEEEARARAEQEEVRRQEAEAQEARAEEQRLADIASDMLLEYMGRTSGQKQRQKAAIFGNVAEDKRSNEVQGDDSDDEFDPETIDKLIEISSKLHLPADDVVEIISDVEEKKKKKDSAASSAPRFRPLVPLHMTRTPIYHYPKSPKKPSYTVKPYKKWYKEKGRAKLNKQDYWAKDYWTKPQKQFLAYPSYPYYQKPYRAYYPVYFPAPKPRYYAKPALSFDYNFGSSMDYGFKPPKRRNRNGAKAKGRNWKQVTRLPTTPYLSNYILPHPRTYQALPMPKPRSPTLRRPPPYYYPPDYVYDGDEPQQESDEELENFIEKIYFNRRMF